MCSRLEGEERVSPVEAQGQPWCADRAVPSRLPAPGGARQLLGRRQRSVDAAAAAAPAPAPAAPWRRRLRVLSRHHLQAHQLPASRWFLVASEVGIAGAGGRRGC
mmetsp:Transcript_14275/g.54070  ORF Transcript_14275/g.54070 Transcript_14275/m.54070 type:complete len:105 (-) Transcript_14275:1106-1420(-)